MYVWDLPACFRYISTSWYKKLRDCISSRAGRVSVAYPPAKPWAQVKPARLYIIHIYIQTKVECAYSIRSHVPYSTTYKQTEDENKTELERKRVFTTLPLRVPFWRIVDASPWPGPRKDNTIVRVPLEVGVGGQQPLRTPLWIPTRGWHYFSQPMKAFQLIWTWQGWNIFSVTATRNITSYAQRPTSLSLLPPANLQFIVTFILYHDIEVSCHLTIFLFYLTK